MVNIKSPNPNSGSYSNLQSRPIKIRLTDRIARAHLAFVIVYPRLHLHTFLISVQKIILEKNLCENIY